MFFGTCKLHTTKSGVMQKLRKFHHNKHLSREMAPLRINTTHTYSYRSSLITVSTSGGVAYRLSYKRMVDIIEHKFNYA